MTPEFRTAEHDIETNLPCVVCGQDSGAYASFNDDDGEGEQWMCKDCCEQCGAV